MPVEDHLDIGGRATGEPHPHAGFETVTLLLDDAIADRDEGRRHRNPPITPSAAFRSTHPGQGLKSNRWNGSAIDDELGSRDGGGPV